jgi:hypothetical protein
MGRRAAGLRRALEEKTMSGKRVLAAVLAGLAMFFWGFVSHAVLRLTDDEVKAPSNEAIVAGAVKGGVSESGLYMIPPMPGRGADDAAKESWLKKTAEGPYALMVVHPAGLETSPVKALATQAISTIVAALIMAILLACAVPTLRSYGRRLIFVTMIGLCAGVLILIPYWNWYHFPEAFVIRSVADITLTALAGGLVLAAMIKRPADI